MITKTDFLRYKQCCKYLWLYKNRKEEFDSTVGWIFDEGDEVESYACKLFPGGVSAFNDDIPTAVSKTKQLIESGQEIIYQPTISNWKLFCRSDIIKLNPETGEWNIYEVKSSTEIKDIYLIDLAFQKICLSEVGMKIGKIYLVYVNNKYIRSGDIDPDNFLYCTEVTAEVEDLIDEVGMDIQLAHKVLDNEGEPEVMILKQCHSPYDCGFKDYCWKHIPEDSIYDISGSLSREKLEFLISKGIIKIKDIPAGMVTKPNGLRHLKAVKTEKVFIDAKAIKNELSELQYPLYFLDYETFGPAAPLFDGYRPYQRIVFQYSLHVKKSPEAKLEHYEYLCREIKDPTSELAESLRGVAGQEGSFISWNKSFEMGCNNEMGARCDQYVDFLNSINDRMYDLMQPFKKGYYVHKDFKGSASLKKVLPVLVPELSYKALNIQEGGAASESWLKVANPELPQAERNQLAQDMLAYCRLDTLAMVEILEVLNKL
ncbi:MAG: DUF2779 domain-containing protein [Candidatus Gastranaerophilales bacterium]|nr:DUF2779 domain-containing protein [Candidatus Gastranaerophilales bacterium]